MESIFTGRDKSLADLANNWKEKRIFGIFGTKSVGKTRFLQEFLQRKSGHHYWIECGNNTSIRGIYLSLSGKLKLSIVDLPDQMLFDISVAKINKINCSPVILILDNAEGIVDSRYYRKFVSFCNDMIRLCSSLKLVVISTTDIEFDDQEFYKISLLPLSTEESVQLLRANTTTVDFGDHVNTIASLCEGCPQALLMVAAELTNDTSVMTVEDLAAILGSNRLSALSPDVYPRQDRINALYKDFLDRLCSSLQKRIAVLGYIPGTFTLLQATEILGHSTTNGANTQTIQPSIQRHVVEVDKTTRRMAISGLLKDCIEEYLKIPNLPEVRQRYCRIFSRIMKNIAGMLNRSEYLEALCLFNSENQNFIKLLTNVIYTNEDTYCLYMEMVLIASNAIQRFMPVQSCKFYETLLEYTRQLHRPVDEASVNIHFGSALTNVQGNLKLGEASYKQAIEFLERTYGDCIDVNVTCYPGFGRDIRFQIALVNQRIGWNLGSQGRLSEALAHLNRAHTFEKELKMETEELILSTIGSLGIFYAAAGCLSEGEKYHKEALRRRIALYKTEEHPSVGACVNNIGFLYLKMGLKDKTLETFQRALDIKEKTRAPEGSIVRSKLNVAHALADVGRNEEGLNKVNEAFQILNKNPRLYMDCRAYCSRVKGFILRKLGQYENSELAFEESVEIESQDSNNTITMSELYLSLANVTYMQGKHLLALNWLGKSARLRQQYTSEIPATQHVYDCCILQKKINEDLKDNMKADQAYSAAVQELERLLKFHSEKKNQQMVSTMKEKLADLKEKYKNSS